MVKGDVFSTSLAQYPELVFIPVLKATQVGIANKCANMLLLIALDFLFDLDEKVPMMSRENSELFGHIFTQVTVDQRIAKLIGEVSEEKLKEIVRHLSTYYSRLSTSGTGMFVWVLGVCPFNTLAPVLLSSSTSSCVNSQKCMNFALI